MRNGLTFLKGATIALAAVGVVFPQTRTLAAEQKLPSKPIVRTLAANSVLDISLTKEGTFAGRTVDHAGSPIEGAQVIVKQGKSEIAQTVTDNDGNFEVKNLKSGVYQVSSGSTEGTYRMWSDQTAPPSAKSRGLLVVGENGTRGQYGFYDAGGSGFFLVAVGGGLLIGGVVTAIILAADADRKAGHNNNSPASP